MIILAHWFADGDFEMSFKLISKKLSAVFASSANLPHRTPVIFTLGMHKVEMFNDMYRANEFPEITRMIICDFMTLVEIN